VRILLKSFRRKALLAVTGFLTPFEIAASSYPKDEKNPLT